MLHFLDKKELVAAQSFLQQAAETNLVSKRDNDYLLDIGIGNIALIIILLYMYVLQHEFVQRLSAVLVTVGASPIARMAAGLQLKNQLTSKDPDMKFQYQQRWLAIPAETREYIKKNVRWHTIRLSLTF